MLREPPSPGLCDSGTFSDLQGTPLWSLGGGGAPAALRVLGLVHGGRRRPSSLPERTWGECGRRCPEGGASSCLSGGGLCFAFQWVLLIHFCTRAHRA